MPPLHVSALHDIAQAQDHNAPAGKARLVTFAGTVVRILRRLDCDWDLDDIPHDKRLWGVHPSSVRLFQKYNRDSANQYPSFCTVVWIADECDGAAYPPCTTKVDEREQRVASKKHLIGSAESPYSSSSSSARTPAVAAGIKRRAEEIVVIDSSDDDSDTRNSSVSNSSNIGRDVKSNGTTLQHQQGWRDMNPAKRRKPPPDTFRTVAMVLPWLEQTNPAQDLAIQPGVRLEIHRAILHVGERRELLACVFNIRTIIDTGDHARLQDPYPLHHHDPKSPRLAFDALQYYDGSGEQQHTTGHRSEATATSTAAMAIVNEIKCIDAQTQSFHLHYLSDIYNTLASSSSSLSFSSKATAASGTSSSSLSGTKPFPPHAPLVSSLQPPPPLPPLCLQRVHRFLCWVTMLKSVHLRSVCVECGQAYKVDRCEFGCSTTRKWQVYARASCIVSDGTGSALVHLNREADVWALLRLGPPPSRFTNYSSVAGKSGNMGKSNTLLAKLLRLLVRVGELAYWPPPNPSSSRPPSSPSSPSYHQRQQNNEPRSADLSERARTERELWSHICEQAVSSMSSPSSTSSTPPSSTPLESLTSHRARLTLYARIQNLSPVNLRRRQGSDDTSGLQSRGLGGVYKGRSWIGGQQITTVSQSQVTLECLALEQLTESYQGQQLTTSRKTSVIESRILLNKLMNK